MRNREKLNPANIRSQADKLSSPPCCCFFFYGDKYAEEVKEYFATLAARKSRSAAWYQENNSITEEIKEKLGTWIARWETKGLVRTKTARDRLLGSGDYVSTVANKSVRFCVKYYNLLVAQHQPLNNIARGSKSPQLKTYHDDRGKSGEIDTNKLAKSVERIAKIMRSDPRKLHLAPEKAKKYADRFADFLGQAQNNPSLLTQDKIAPHMLKTQEKYASHVKHIIQLLTKVLARQSQDQYRYVVEKNDFCRLYGIVGERHEIFVILRNIDPKMGLEKINAANTKLDKLMETILESFIKVYNNKRGPLSDRENFKTIFPLYLMLESFASSATKEKMCRALSAEDKVLLGENALKLQNQRSAQGKKIRPEVKHSSQKVQAALFDSGKESESSNTEDEKVIGHNAR